MSVLQNLSHDFIVHEEDVTPDRWAKKGGSCLPLYPSSLRCDLVGN